MNTIATRERCQMCHQISSVGFWVPDETWKASVHPHFENSILCIRCFSSQADEKLVEWDREIKFYPVSLVTHFQMAIGTEPLSGHIDSRDCWCCPELQYEDPKTGLQVWLHKRIQ